MTDVNDLIYKILSVLHKSGCITIIKVKNGITVKDEKNNISLHIGEDLLDEKVENIVDGVDLNLTLFSHSKDKILDDLSHLLFKNLGNSKLVQKEYILLAQSIQELLDGGKSRKSKSTTSNEGKGRREGKRHNGSVVCQIKNGNGNKRIILLKDYISTEKIHHEAPMIANLQKVWKGKKLHQNFVVMSAIHHGNNQYSNKTILCEFDAIGILDDVLCIFEIKNKSTNEVPKFLQHFFEYVPYILEWLKKNQYSINYIAPVLYIRENVDYNNPKLNVITYDDVLNNKPVKLQVVYPNFDGKIFESEIGHKNVVMIDGAEDSEEDNVKNEGYSLIKIPKGYYDKMKNLVDNNEFFNSEEDFVEFAFENAFNIIKMLKKE